MMWPLDLPAHEVLKLPGETIIPWAVFDANWYLRTYPDTASIADMDDPRDVLRFYLEVGQGRRHSPNRMFDERWHRLAYPQIAERVMEGDYLSAFDAYCRRGALDRSAHWLFDELAYRARYPDLTNDVLAGIGIFNGYDHYLRHGVEEDRIGHPLFDPDIYLSHFAAADVAAIRRSGVFQHYLNRIESNEPELPTSIYFDPIWYVKRYPEVAREIAAKQWKCALQHYLCNDTPTEFDPLEQFSEEWYLRRDPGLAEVIAERHFRNGYMHFLQFGAKELRSPSAQVELAWYADQPAVRADLEQGRAANAFAHWLTIGASAGSGSAALQAVRLTDEQARQQFHQAATALLPIAGRFGYRFHCVNESVVSVVMAVRDGFATTMATIAALRSNTASDIELIIVDRGSQDETRSIGQYVPGAKILRLDSDCGWARAADAGRQLAGSPAVLFLSSDAQIAPGAVEHARARLAADASVGAVGGMIVQSLGVVAQAGGILWNDGGIHDYQCGASPLAPEVNFVRDVDFCSPAFLMLRSTVLSELDGLDLDCAAGYEAVDLCLRVAAAGLRVVYDPSVMLVLGDRTVPDGGVGEHFQRKHAALLAQRFAPGGAVQVVARHAGAKPHRILFIEDTVPLRRIGSGFVRANDLIQVMASLGYALTVFPVNGCDHDLAHVYGDMPESVEVMHTFALDRLAAFLESRAGYYDTVWVARIHNLRLVRPILARLTAEGILSARIILDTEAVTPHREMLQAALADMPYDLDSAMKAILADADISQQAVAVTLTEAETLRLYGFANVSMIGHMIEPRPTERSFGQRAGLLFVGAIHQQDSPNLDSLIWFVDAVLPLIEAALQWETRLTIAGHVAAGIDLGRFAQHPRISLRGPVADLDPLYNAHRVFVAPTRYAAGAPYKILEAASRGLPVVGTDLLRAELDWLPQQEMLSAEGNDPAAFAAHVVALYRDEAVWREVRERALRRLERDNGRAGFCEAVAAVLAPGPVEKAPLKERLRQKKRTWT
jgi:glycosyltransferase involved in cell wall biosynthesis